MNSVEQNRAEAPQEGGCSVVLLERDEMAEVRRAIELRKRTSGVGTDEHKVCERVLRKLDQSKLRQAAGNGSGGESLETRA